MKKRRNFRKRPKDTAQGLSVTVYNNNVEEALKRLKRKVKNSNLLKELRERDFYEKPSVARRKRKKLRLAKIRSLHLDD